ncbi:MAG: hypothetical protein QOI32_485 [Thermoleophilaceae bacterium]|jgi:dihydroorotase-like cyclic amidohydrolase|nr:hypothetical protein [Thermoleophilaceae bacterium]
MEAGVPAAAPAIVPEWRSREAELNALAVALVLARSARARVILAHVSNADALALVTRERAAGADVGAESGGHFLPGPGARA